MPMGRCGTYESTWKADSGKRDVSRAEFILERLHRGTRFRDEALDLVVGKWHVGAA